MKNALHTVCSENHFPDREGEIRKLITAGWDVNARDDYGCDRTPLHIAVKNSLCEAVRILIDAQADVGAVDAWGNTPLLFAYCHSVELLSALVAAGADVNQCNRNGNTPLISAAGGSDFSWKRNTHDNQMAFFIAMGADVNAVNHCGWTALHFAASCRGGSDAVKQLLDAKANPNVNDGEGHAPLYYARTSIVAETLIHAGATVDADALKNPRVVKARDRLLERQARAQRRALAKPAAAARPRRRA